MDKDVRNAIERATQKARRILEEDYAEQLDGVFDVRADGRVPEKGGAHLTGRQHILRDKIVAAIEHKRIGGMKPAEAVADYIRDAAFTTLNRFVALKMLEARELVQECISRGDVSSGFAEFCGLAPAVKTADGAGYRLYIESIFDELSTEVKVLFDRRDAASVLWPKKATFDDLLAVLNTDDLKGVWGEDETIGWVYQFFNSAEERRQMRDESQAPRNSRELAIRNQFFTPQYVIQFLCDNTLGHMWYEMRRGDTRLDGICEYMVRPPNGKTRAKKDPRDIRIIDPACGSGHFLLYCFVLLLPIYEEAWADETVPESKLTGKTLRTDYPTFNDLRKAAPELIVRHNLHGVDIDPRCAQIAQLALWMRVQRAFSEAGIPRSERPMIRRANIVIAEPMPGDTKLVEEFARTLRPAIIGNLFKEIVSEMRLAGEMGALLQIERKLAVSLDRARVEFAEQQNHDAEFLPGLAPVKRQIELDLSGIGNSAFFENAEEQIFASLKKFVSDAANGRGTRRKLFADDAEQGLAFVELMMKRFDVLIMNPPFGDATPTTTTYLEEKYYATRLDLFAAFCERLLDLATPGGLVGAITPRDGFFKKTLTGWRELVLKNHMPVVADLGLGVLDGATVRVAAYILCVGPSTSHSLFFDVLDLPDREIRLQEEIDNNEPKRVFSVQLSSFKALPLCRFLYWLPDRLWEIYARSVALENLACTPRYGLATFDDERFCRLSFEVPATAIGPGRVWAFMSKGGDDYPYGGVSNAVVKWQDDAAEMAEVNRRSNGQVAQTRRASRFYFRPAVSFSNRSVQFSVRWHPANFAFSMRGPAIIPISASQAYLMGFFNSRLIRTLIQMQTASQTYTTGVLKELRWVEPDALIRDTVESAASEAFFAVRCRLAAVETDPFFTGIFSEVDGERPRSVADFIHWRKRFADDLNASLSELQSKIDRAIAQLYGVSADDIERCERADDEETNYVEFPPRFSFAQDAAETLVSYLWGVAIGRWQVMPIGKPPSLRESAPQFQPATSGRNAKHQIVVEDSGHPNDIVALIEASLALVFPDRTDEDLDEIEKALGTTLRQWISQSFFSRHRTMYSGFGRSAPVYWQFGTASGRYSVWLFIHVVTKDTLFRVQDELIAPKLAHEQSQLNSLRADAGTSSTAKQQKDIEEQEAFVAELNSLLNEVKRIAPLWNPDFVDGILLNAAPLWRLFVQNRLWQNEVKECWETLCEGMFDWSHIAMRLWPERVIPKCAEDRSLAIAHGLEDIFWFEGENGKWKPRTAPRKSLADLVSERTSPSVKAALKGLFDAPEPASGVKRSRKTKAA